MKQLIQEILNLELSESIHSITTIEGLGSVNKIFDVKGINGDYIIRLNEDPKKETEYVKEKWCIETVDELGVPSPKVLGMGRLNDVIYMIQEKLPGRNGKECSTTEKENIWRKLGGYAKRFHQIERIEVREVIEEEFHDSWLARLDYNIKELNAEDSLLSKQVLLPAEQRIARKLIAQLHLKTFYVGLVHADLCPRNVIYNNGQVHLLDWGTADVNVIPHNELGIILMSKEASENEFEAFLEGYGISKSAYLDMEYDILLFNLLQGLDKYRWAEEYAIENIKEYGDNIRGAFNKLRNLEKVKIK